MQENYRFIEQPDKHALDMATILQPPVDHTVMRIRDQQRVLCLQESLDLDYTCLDGCASLGHAESDQWGATFYGLRLHTTLALTEDGRPLGILHADCLARTMRQGKNRKNQRRIEVKESCSWLHSVQACEEISGQVPGVKLVCLMDREGEIFEVFQHWQKTRKVELLVRIRCGDGEIDGALFEQVRATPAGGQVEILVRKRKNKASQALPPEVMLTVRHTPITLQVPKGRKLPGAVPIHVWMIHALEQAPPPNTTPIEWYLISSEPVESFEKACQSLREHASRQQIEEWHRVLKSGCGEVEIIAEDLEMIESALAINLVTAWRILLMKLHGRKGPDLSPEMLFSDLELRVLRALAAKDKWPPPEMLKQAVFAVAKLGGYLGRKSDPQPGAIVLWRGYISLQAMCRGVALMESSGFS